jgi:hypothetical protein
MGPDLSLVASGQVNTLAHGAGVTRMSTAGDVGGIN